MRHVLVVEDDPTISEVLCTVLEDEGYEAECVATIADARASLARNRPSCVVLDFHLPDGTAEEIIRAAVGTPTSPPMMIVSASPVAPKVAEQFRIPLVRKPFEIDDIIKMVAATIAEDRKPVASA